MLSSWELVETFVLNAYLAQYPGSAVAVRQWVQPFSLTPKSLKSPEEAAGEVGGGAAWVVDRTPWRRSKGKRYLRRLSAEKATDAPAE
eukprot:262925-Rhodomonas_salina.1